MILEADGRSYRLAVADASPRLASASDAERKFFRVSPSGYGMHWPELDEDLSVDGLIRAASGTTTYPLAPQTPASALNDKPNP